MNFGWFHNLRLRVRALLWRRRLDRDLQAEIEFHLAERAARSNLSPEEARRRFGNPTVLKETSREMWTFRWIEILLQDLRYAARTLRKSPGFAIVAVLTLALGIGADTAIFSVVDSVLLRPLPYAQPSRLVELWGNVKRIKIERRGASYPDFYDWRAQSRSFETMASLDPGVFTLTGVDEPERLSGEFVSQTYFDLLGVRPALGRTFRREEDQVPQRNAVIVIGDSLWKRRFGGDPAIAGRTLQIGGKDYTILGVMPAWFHGITDQSELWMPSMMAGTAADFAERGTRSFPVLARLSPCVSVAQAQTELDGIARRLQLAYPETNEGRAVEVARLDRELLGDLRQPLLVLLCAVAFVLLIACSNVASLMLARSEARQREIAMRIAVGAGRGRVLLQLFTESCVLALLGAAGGLTLAHWGARALVAASPVTFPSFIHPGLDLRVAVFCTLIACASGVALGIAPAAQLRNANLADSFKQASSHAADRRDGRRFRAALVVAEIAFAMLLLTGAGLLVRSVRELAAIQPGYDPSHLLTLRIGLPRPADARELENRLSRIPSVEAVGLGSDVPLDGAGATFYAAEGQPPVTAQNRPRAYPHRVSPDFFRTLRIRFLAGRTFTNAEVHDAAAVVIVSESLAKRFWPGADPIGKRIKTGSLESKTPWMTIVGVVNELKYRGLPNNPTPDPDLFVPISGPVRNPALMIRTTLPPASLAPAVRQVLREFDGTAVIYGVRTLEALVERETASSRFTGWLMGIFAASALLLAMIGIYGLMSYSVARRTREIGIRMALGADRRQVLRMVTGHAMRQIAAGLALGAALAYPLARLIDNLLYNVKPGDPLAFLAAALALALAALLACLGPATRATRIAPASALRNE
jgi:putative ABC transport system permease protein